MIMISSDSCLLLSLLFPLFFTRAFPILERGFASYLLTRKAESALCRLSLSYKFLSPPSLLHHISADSIVRMSGETRALDGFYEALYTERTKCKVSRRFRDENAQKVLPPRAFSLASKQVVNIHFRLKLRLISPLEKNQSRRRRRRSLGSTSIESGGR